MVSGQAAASLSIVHVTSSLIMKFEQLTFVELELFQHDVHGFFLSGLIATTTLVRFPIMS